MSYITIGQGLTLMVPGAGQANWGTVFQTEFAEKISAHDHTGAGKGVLIGSSAISSDAINGTHVRLSNNQGLRSNLAGGTAHETIKLDTSDNITINAPTGKEINFGVGGTASFVISGSGLRETGGAKVLTVSSAAITNRVTTAEVTSQSGNLKLSAALSLWNVQITQGGAIRFATDAGTPTPPAGTSYLYARNNQLFFKKDTGETVTVVA